MRVRLNLVLTDLDLDAAGRVLEVEEGDLAAAALEDPLAVALDHPADADLAPRVHRGERARGRDLEAPELDAVAIERMAGDVEAERVLLLLQGLAEVPRLDRGAVGHRDRVLGERAFLHLRAEHREEIALPGLAIAARRASRSRARSMAA